MRNTYKIGIMAGLLLAMGAIQPAFATGGETYYPYATNVFSGPSQIVMGDGSTLDIIDVPAAYASGLDTSHTYTWTLYISPNDTGAYQAVASISGSGSATRTIQWPAGSISSGFGAWEARDDVNNLIGRGLYAPPPTNEFWESDSNVVIGPLAYTGDIASGYLHQDNPLYEGIRKDNLGQNGDSIIFWRENTGEIDCASVTSPSDLTGDSVKLRRISDIATEQIMSMVDALEYLSAGNTGVDVLSGAYLKMQCFLGFASFSDNDIPLKSPAWDVWPAAWTANLDPMLWHLEYGVYQYVYDCLCATSPVGNGLLPLMRNTPQQVIDISAPFTNRDGNNAKLVLTSIYEPEYWEDLESNEIRMCAPTPCVEVSVDASDYTYAESRTISELGIGDAGNGVGVSQYRLSDALPYGDGGETNIYWAYRSTTAYTVADAVTIISGTQDTITTAGNPSAMSVAFLVIVAIGIGMLALFAGMSAIAIIIGATIVSIVWFALPVALAIIGAIVGILAILTLRSRSSEI